MLKQRIIGVVTVKDGRAVQSIGYGRYLPLGSPVCLVENLDRWGVDEILVQVIDRSTRGAGPDFALLEQLGRLGLETPLIYGGGIRSVEDGVRAIQLGADRLVMDALLRDALPLVRDLADHLGAQALIAALPLGYTEGLLEWLDYRRKLCEPLSGKLLEEVAAGSISEVLIIDWRHEGMRGGFCADLLRDFPLAGVPKIVFGGVSEHEQVIDLLRMSDVAAVAIGNFLNYREHAVQRLKEELASVSRLRPPIYMPNLHSSNV